MIKQDYMDEEWFAILSSQVANSSRRKVAKRLGYSLTAISLVMNGKYVGSTERLSKCVMLLWAKVECPHTQSKIPLLQCRELSAAVKAPTHNPLKMQQWRACQRCPNRVKEKSCRATDENTTA